MATLMLRINTFVEIATIVRSTGFVVPVTLFGLLFISKALAKQMMKKS